MKEQHIVNIKNIFFHFFVGDILKARDGNSLMGSFILTLCSIDCISYLDGNTKMCKWIDENLKLINKDYDGDLIERIRNGLVHNSGTSFSLLKYFENKDFKSIGYYFGNNKAHCYIYNSQYFFNPDLLLVDYILALNIYFNKLLKLPDAKKESFISKSNSIIGFYDKNYENWDLMKYEEIHPLLKSMDEKGNLDPIVFKKSYFHRASVETLTIKPV